MRRLRIATACLIVVGSVLAAAPAVASEDTTPPTVPSKAVASEDTTPPTVPSNLRLTRLTPYEYDLAWEGSTDDSGQVTYQVTRVELEIETEKTSGTFRPFYGPPFPERQDVSVRARDPNGNRSAWSNRLVFDMPRDTQTPTPPRNLRVTAKTSTTVTFEWDAATDDFPETVFYTIKTLDNEPMGFYQLRPFQRTMTYLSPNTTYEFVATASDGYHNESGHGNVVTVTTDP